jgi:hypothetical protein
VFAVLHYGTYLFQHWNDESDVNHYHYVGEGKGFIVEVGVDYGQEQPVLLRSLVSSVPL